LRGRNKEREGERLREKRKEEESSITCKGAVFDRREWSSTSVPLTWICHMLIELSQAPEYTIEPGIKTAAM
jgi:hypothetical protein